MLELEKPWRSLEEYRKTRLLEARYEAELARRFLEEGLVRNAAGKAFQAWKALLAAELTRHVEELEKEFQGTVTIREGKRVKKAHWILSIVPAAMLKRLSQIAGDEFVVLTALALQLHQFQYNGPDKEGVLSPYRSEEEARRDVELLLRRIGQMLGDGA
ncbi:MAG: PaREP1 family protein [Pyrobaculum sp.]